MWPNIFEGIYSEFSSQTSNINFEELANIDEINLGFYDATTLIIEPPRERPWDIAANEVLQDNKELWERLAEI